MKNLIHHGLVPRTAACAALFLVAAASNLRAQTSPEGPWDLVLSGSQKGVVQITFNADHTLDGTEVITAKAKANSDDDNPRGTLDGGLRVDGSESNTNSATNVYFYGTSPLAGFWSMDPSGIIIGILHEGDESMTNGISFRGKRRGNRLNLKGHHQGRTLHYRGVPLVTQSDISGNFYTQGRKDGEPYLEFLNLAPDATPNQYIVTGQGPAYTFDGVALLSGQKYLAIAAIQSVGTNGVLSAVSGSFNINKGRGSLSGVSELNRRVTAKIYKQPDLPE